MKRILSFAFALTLATLLSACGSGGSSAAPAPESTGGETQGTASESAHVAISMNVLDDFQSTWFEYFTAAVEEMGATVSYTNAEGSVDKQLTDVDSLIQLGPDVILIRALDPDGLVPAFQACVDAGIPVIDDEYGINFENCVSLFSSQYALGEMQGRWCADQLAADEALSYRVGYLWGVQTQVATQDRFAGWNDVLSAEYPDRYEIVAEKPTNWSAVEAMNIVEDWLQANPDINLIVAQGDELAIAAANVLEAAGLTGEIAVLGIDGSEDARVNIRAGRVTGSAYIDAPSVAQNVASYAVQVAKGEVVAPAQFDIGEGAQAFLTAENIDAVLASFGAE